MTKETFKKILELQSEHYQKEQKLYELGLDTVEFNTPLIAIVEALWNEVLTEEGSDWLSWFMFEKFWISGEPREDMKAFDGDVEIVKDLDGLYDYLVSNSYFRGKND